MRSFLVVVMVLLATTAAAQDKEPLLVFAAASLSGPLDSLADDYLARTGHPVLIAYGASGTLAQQIQIGADVDLFISADTAWVMRLVNERSAPVRRWLPFLRNRLVLVTASGPDQRMLTLDSLNSAAIGRIAIADPEAAPAGRYARAYLQRAGLYDRLRGKLVIQEDVRGVVHAVRLGVADVGFVYASDVATGNLRVIATVPDSLHPPIVYGLTVMRGGQAEATDGLVKYLTGAAAARAFEAAGFITESATFNR
jgi:molybdate transport system substrate-binding protein